jgi:hypothetical protein
MGDSPAPVTFGTGRRRRFTAFIGVLALALSSGLAGIAVPVASASGGNGACPADGPGGPLLRVCSVARFGSKAYAPIAVFARVVLPCTTGDFVPRRIQRVHGGPAVVTTDEGYTYFAVYAPGDEIEIGFEHLSNRPSPNNYKLYVRHGGFWQSTDTYTCGVPVDLQFNISYRPNLGTGPAFLQIDTDVKPYKEPTGFAFSFLPTPSDPTVTAAQGHGRITPLTSSGWDGACPACRMAQITSIAQNGPFSSVPARPLPDGARFGPVTWSYTRFFTLPCHGPVCTEVSWNDNQTATVYKSPSPALIATTGTDGAAGYTASISMPCIPSALPDKWACPRKP